MSSSAAGIINILPFIPVPSVIAISSLANMAAVFSVSLIQDQEWITISDSMPMCSLSSDAVLIFSAMMLSDMLVHDAIALMVMHMPRIDSPLFIS